MKIAMIASEANPFVKTGGLADVSYALSKELASMGEKVVLFLPLYKCFHDKIFPRLTFVTRVEVNMAWRKNSSNVYKVVQDKITYYLIENQQYFERDGIYGYGDDGERFAYFVMASYEALKAIKFKPDIVHVHDWQSAMFPCYAKERREDFFSATKYVLTIHNPAFQGLLQKEALGDLYNLPLELYFNGNARFKDMVSTLKCGIMYADKIVTVSPTHRGELLSPELGMGLSSILVYREYDFCGILNGIDYLEFDPEHDQYLPTGFNVETVKKVKKSYRDALVKEYDLKITGKPLFAMVSRLTWQKGLDILVPVVEELARKGCGVFILGSGEYKYEQAFQSLRDRYPHNVAVYLGYSNALAHRVYACSDIFLMPSLFEPCGLGQMIAERYGSLPLVRRCGGLRDSVISYEGNNDEYANGFGFDEYSYDALNNTCTWAISTYENKKVFDKLVKNALKTDNSWRKSVLEYLGVYKSLL